MTLIAQSKSKQIGACSYSVEPLPWKAGRKSLTRILPVIAPALAAIEPEEIRAAFADKDALSSGAKGVSLIARVLSVCVSNLTDEHLQELEDLYRPRTVVTLPDGLEPVLKDLPEHFATPGVAGLADYVQWLVHCILTTHGDFFTGAFLSNADSKSKAQTKAE